jgi:hypothetical protein
VVLPLPCSLLRRSLAGVALVGTVAAAAACGAAGGAPSPAHGAALADTLAGVIAAAYDFSRPGVPERLLGLYPAQGPVVSAAAGGLTTSRAALRGEIERFWSRVGQNMRDARFVVGDRHVTVLGPTRRRSPSPTPSRTARPRGGRTRSAARGRRCSGARAGGG